MSTQVRASLFAILLMFICLVLRPLAQADDFQFSFATDPTACSSYSGGCGLVDGSGIFVTAPVTQTLQFGAVNVYPITSLTGTFDGSSMTLSNPGSSAIIQSTLNLPPFGPGVIFMSNGQQYELEFNEGPNPGGSSDLLYSFATNTFTNVALNVSPVSVPEPAELSLIGAGLLGLAAVKLRRDQILRAAAKI
jgi:hypothetical protein